MSVSFVLRTQPHVLPLQSRPVFADLVEGDAEVSLLVQVGLVVVLEGDRAVAEEREGVVQHVQDVTVRVVPENKRGSGTRVNTGLELVIISIQAGKGL